MFFDPQIVTCDKLRNSDNPMFCQKLRCSKQQAAVICSSKRSSAGHFLLLRASSRLLRPRLLLPGLALGLVSWSAEGLGLHLICQGLSIDVPPMTAIGVFAIAGLAGAAAFFMPGGIGGMELVMIALLTTLGAPASGAIVATLICRVATLWFAVIVGFVAATLLEFLSLRPAPRSAP